MKKISTLAFLVATAFPAIYAVEPVPVPVKLVSAPSREISATNTEIILETPEGTLVDPLYSISENSYFIYSSALVSMSTNGYAGAMVRTDDAIYVRNMISQFDQSSTYWVKGDVESDGSVTFRFPQLVYHRDASGDVGASDRYVALLTPVADGESIRLTTDVGNCDLHMQWDGDRLIQVMPEISDTALKPFAGIVGLVDGSGDFLGYGEQGLAYKASELVLLTPPADLATNRYVLDYVTGDGSPKSGVITVGTSGDDVWFKGFNSFISEAWVKGELKEGKVSIPSTYTGVYEGYVTYVTGLSSDDKELVAPVTLTVTEDGYKVDGKMFVSIGDEVVDYNDNRVIADAVMTPYAEGERIPATPVIDTSEEGTEAFNEEEGMGALIFTMEPVDIEGNTLEQSNLYYNIFRNGELYTFNKDEYFLETDMTYIPYDFQSDLIMSMYGYFFVFFLEDMDSIGVRAVYQDGDTTTYSEIATYVFHETGVESVGASSEVVSVEYLDLGGRRVADPGQGIYIRLTHYADGSSKASKTVVRK